MSGSPLESEAAPVLVPPVLRARRALGGPAIALGVIVATVLVFVWGGVQGYYVLTDAWIAPLHLSPDSDAVSQLRRKHAWQLAELARLDTEVSRIDAEIATLDIMVAQLTAFERTINASGALPWPSGREVEALHAGIARATGSPFGVLKDIATGEDAADRLELELELQRLQLASRGSRALRAVAIENTVAQRTLLAELESQPTFRAIKASTQIAFVPYDELTSVRAGAHVIACTWHVFGCRDVGRVTEILAGQATMRDPTGELTSGQYVVLVLDDKDAFHERVLRVRS